MEIDRPIFAGIALMVLLGTWFAVFYGEKRTVSNALIWATALTLLGLIWMWLRMG